MAENNTNRDENSKGSSKRLVKILVIVGIGIPVLVELMTLFNLINVQIFEDEKNEAEQSEEVTEVREVAKGDTLFSEYSHPIVLDQFRVKVSAQQWRFELGLSAVDSLTQETLQIRADSLRLQSDKVLLESDSSSWELKNEIPVKILAEWELPYGDIPDKLYLSVLQEITEDSTVRINQQVPLKKIPIRYNNE